MQNDLLTGTILLMDTGSLGSIMPSLDSGNQVVDQFDRQNYVKVTNLP